MGTCRDDVVLAVQAQSVQSCLFWQLLGGSLGRFGVDVVVVLAVVVVVVEKGRKESWSWRWSWS